MNEQTTLEKLKYPIGKFQADETVNRPQIEEWIKEIAALPFKLREAVKNLTEEQLNTPYRPDGWTVKQVVHHIGDSHMNSYIRFKLALTEDKPVIKPYDEKRWAELPDYQLGIEEPLDFLESLHKRWVNLLAQLNDMDLEKEFIHPESGTKNLKETIGQYAWHGNHHLAQITSLKKRMGW
jgi:hypothetical protein